MFLDELREVFERNKIDLTLVRSFLTTYTNISIVEREFSDELIELVKKVVADRKDRPVFIYALILRKDLPYRKLVNEVIERLTEIARMEIKHVISSRIHYTELHWTISRRF